MNHRYDIESDCELWEFSYADGTKRKVYDPCTARALMQTMAVHL